MYDAEFTTHVNIRPVTGHCSSVETHPLLKLENPSRAGTWNSIRWTVRSGQLSVAEREAGTDIVKGRGHGLVNNFELCRASLDFSWGKVLRGKCE